MEHSKVTYDLREGIGCITLEGPKGLNIMSRESLKALGEVLAQCKEDPACRAVIVTGSGDRAFSAGADVNIFLELSQRTLGATDWAHYGQALFGHFRNLGKPSIAAVNGLALGGGFEMVLSCTFRIASQKAKFGLPEITHGFIPGWGGTQLLPRLLGRSAALEMILTGEMIDATEAERLGLVSRVVPPEELIPACESLAKRIIKNSADGVRLALDAVNQGADLPLERALALEADLAGFSCVTEEAKKQIRAFLKKEK